MEMSTALAAPSRMSCDMHSPTAGAVLKPVPLKPQSRIEPVRAGGSEQGVLIRRDAIVAAVGRVQAASLDGRNAAGEPVDAALNEARQGAVGVAIR